MSSLSETIDTSSRILHAPGLKRGWRGYLSGALFLILVMVTALGFIQSRGSAPLGIVVTSHPSDHLWEVTEIKPVSAAANTGIRVGDQVVAIDGVPVSQLGAPSRSISSASNVILIRPDDGSVMRVDSSVGAPNRGGLAFGAILAAAVGAVALFFGRGKAPAALALLCFSGAFELAVLAPVYFLHVWALVIHGLALPMSVGAILYLALLFPTERQFHIRRLKVLPEGILVVAAACSISFTLSLFSPTTYAKVLVAFLIYDVVCIFGGFGLLVFSWLTAGSDRDRAQLRIMALGVGLGLLPFLLLCMLPLILFGKLWVSTTIGLLPLILLPAALTYAVLRHQLMNLRIYVKKGTVYTGLFALLIGIYGLALAISSALIRSQSNTTSIITVAIASAIVAVVALPARDFFQLGVDRLFDRRHYDYRQQLFAFSQRMNAILDANELANSTVELVAGTTGATHTSLYLYDPETLTYRLWAGVATEQFNERQVLGAHHPLIGELRSAGDVVQHLDMPPDGDALLLGISNKGEPLALLVLGPKAADLPYSSEDIALLRTVGNGLAIATENVRLYNQMRDLYLSGVRTLAATVDAKDSYTHGHSTRVSDYSRAIAQELGLPQQEIETIELAGLLHDIGKIGVPDHVLQKPGKLDPDERAMIEEHAAMGARILADNRALMPLVPLVRHHHEWFNGNGYPDHLAGADIPLGAAIISVADTFDTMTTDRPYRKSPGLERARAELIRCSGTQFHPDVIEAFIRVLNAQSEPANGAQQLAAGKSASSWIPSLTGSGRGDSAVETRAMHLIYQLAQLVGSEPNLDVFLSGVTNLLRQELGTEQVEILLLDIESGQLSPPSGSRSARSSPSQRIAGWVAREQTPIVIADTRLDARTSAMLDQEGPGHSLLAVPISSKSEPANQSIGVLLIEGDKPGMFAEDDLDLLMAVMPQLAQRIDSGLLHRRIQRNATSDQLTGLANHTQLFERLETALADAREYGMPVTVVVLGLNQMRQINDEYGVLAGDAALRAFSRALQRGSRPLDIIARLGGDEFVVVIPGLGEAEGRHQLERITRGAADATFSTGNAIRRLPPFVSGMASYPADGDRAVMLLSAAQERMQLQKSARHQGDRGATPAG